MLMYCPPTRLNWRKNFERIWLREFPSPPEYARWRMEKDFAFISFASRKIGTWWM